MAEEQVLEIAEQPLPEETVEDIMSDAMIKRAAAYAAAGVTARQTMAKKLGVSNYFAAKIMRDDRFKQLVEEIGNDAVAVSKAQLKNEVAKLAPLAVKALTANLKRDNLQAAITVLRAMGVETAAKDDGADKGGLTLILAGQKPAEQKATIQVVKEDEK